MGAVLLRRLEDALRDGDPIRDELKTISEILLKRDISYSEEDAIAKESEIAMLYRDMRSDAVQQLLRRQVERERQIRQVCSETRESGRIDFLDEQLIQGSGEIACQAERLRGLQPTHRPSSRRRSTCCATEAGRSSTRASCAPTWTPTART